MTDQEKAAADAAAASTAAADAKAAEDAAKAAAGTPAADDETKLELERTRIALKAANREAQERRKRLEELETAETARKQADLTETDKLKAELEASKKQTAAAEAKAREMLVRSAFVAEAAKLNAAHPADVYLLADMAAIDVDESGVVTGVAEAVKALVDAGRVPISGKPLAPGLDGGAGGHHPAAKGTSVKLSDTELEAARKMRMTPERYAAQKVAAQGDGMVLLPGKAAD